MSFKTVPAYVQHPAGWPDATREHPAIDFMFEFEQALDFGDLKTQGYPASHLTADFVYKCNGTAHPPGKPSWDKYTADIAGFTAHYHEPLYYVIYETATGWELVGTAAIYVNLPAPGEGKVKDLMGREWDFKMQGAAFHFELVKDASGIKGVKLGKQEVVGDMLALAAELVKRGMVTWEQAAEMLK